MSLTDTIKEPNLILTTMKSKKLSTLKENGIIYAVLVSQLELVAGNYFCKDYDILIHGDDLASVRRLGYRPAYSDYKEIYTLHMNNTDIEEFKNNMDDYRIKSRARSGKVYEIYNKSFKRHCEMLEAQN